MKRTFQLLCTGFLASLTGFALEVASPADQIASSTLAAPEERRAAATVLGYNAEGKVVTLRQGTNDVICLADDPAVKAFSVACYHKDLEPFMARGRETRGGVQGQGAARAALEGSGRRQDQDSARAAPLYVLTGTGFDAAKGEVTDAVFRWVIYSPFATPESTGLSTTAVAGRALADVSGHRGRAHHDQPAEEVGRSGSHATWPSCRMETTPLSIFESFGTTV